MSSRPEPPAAAAESPFQAVPSPLRAALERRGFAALTSVQAAVLAHDLGARDLQITSQTGSGKTIALGFALAPVLLAATRGARGPTTLAIAPTRELAMQVRDELQWLYADARSVTFDCVTGGTSVPLERRRLLRQPTVLVGTPGRLLDHLRSGALNLGAVTQLVLDEADQMLDLGFRDELEELLKAMPAERRTHLVSATFPEAVRALTQRYQKDPLHVEGTALGSANVDIDHVAHLLGGRDRYAALVNLLLLAGDARTLVFVRTREDTTGLADKLAGDGFAAQPISGDLTQSQRTRTLDAFRRGTITTLIATDVAARGLDIPDVASVVQVDPPIDAETYTHRSGRTGRAGQKGTCVILVPKAAERRVRRLHREAKVQAQWKPVPDAATVRAAQDERTLQKLRAALTASTPDAAQLALAERLLAEHAPATLVATLLGQAGTALSRAPFEVESPRPSAGPPPHRGESRPARHGDRSDDREHPRTRSRPPMWGARAAAAFAEAAADHGHARRPAAGHRGHAGFVRFTINWGTDDGAEPKRILAHICRRGDVTSSAVGTIELGARRSTFEIEADVAASFARRVQRPDRRDPHLVITEADGKPAHRGPPPRPYPKKGHARSTE